MCARLITLNLEPVDLPSDATWQPWPFGHIACAVIETDDPEQLCLQLPEVASSGVVAGPFVGQPACLVMMGVGPALTTTETIDLLAEHTGTGELTASITGRATYGESDFVESLWERVTTLRGLPIQVFGKVLPRITLSPGARELVATFHEAGTLVGVTSDGFTMLVAPLVGELDLDLFNVSELKIRNRVLMSRVIGTAVDRDREARDLIRFAVTSQMPLEHTVAVGDDANDLGMPAAARLGVAYQVKPVTTARADVVINFPRLDAVTILVLS